MKYNLRNRFCISGLIILLFLIIVPGNFVLAKGTVNLPKSSSEARSSIGIDEKLGNYVPLDLTFHDESGKPLHLKDILNKPVIVSLVYYHCADICLPYLGGIVDVLEKLQATPGKDYTMLTISIDETDSAADAVNKKKNYIKAFKKSFPEKDWKFLTGDGLTIKRFTDAVGFRFKKEGDKFLHPASLIILSPRGKIVRYLYGVTFLPIELQMALTEALQERSGPTIARALLICFSYDPKGRKYVFDILKVSGIVTAFFAVTFFVYLTVRGGTRPKKT